LPPQRGGAENRRFGAWGETSPLLFNTVINDWLLEVCKVKGRTQEEFANRIKISRSIIGSIKKGRREVKDLLFILFHLTFAANEQWIKTGKGSMFDTPQNEWLERIIHHFKKLDENSQDFILGYLELLLEYRKKEGKKQATFQDNKNDIILNYERHYR
jgi:transcriptional regulator with XRE-family HTH domain